MNYILNGGKKEEFLAKFEKAISKVCSASRAHCALCVSDSTVAGLIQCVLSPHLDLTTLAT